MKVVVITSSGALSPGPLTFSILKKGTEEGARAGFFASLGHMVVELPLVYLIGLGVITFLFNDFVMFITGIVGGVFILLFGVLTINDARKGIKCDLYEQEEERRGIFQSSFMIGFNLSAFNPFFIAWWIAIGSILTIEAYAYGGLIGIAEMYIAHVWMDFAWLILLAYLANLGSRILESKGYRLLLLLIGTLLIYFGLTILIQTIS